MHLYQSYNYRCLTQKLSEIYNKDNSSIFRKEYIFYQAKGIVERLPADMAAISGFFGGADFYPIFKMEGIVADILGLNPDAEFNRVELEWNIYLALGSDEFKNAAVECAEYFHNDNLKRMLLAGKLQESFSSYIEFQPELLRNWENGIYIEQNLREKWQAKLWHLLLKIDSFRNKWASTENIANSLRIEKEQALVLEKLPRIFLFGISSVSDQTLSLLKLLSECGVEIHFFLFSPLNNKNRENNFVDYLAKPAFDTDLLFKKHFSNLSAEELVPDSEPKNTNLYNLQQLILSAADTDLLPILEDDSLTLNSNYTAVRELESLYQHLLYLNSKDTAEPLLPKDILVLIPNLEEYTPFISSVFESGDYLYNFPYSIEKQHFNSIDSKAAVVDSLLNFKERNFTSEQVLQLLENKALSDVFGINDLDKLRELLAEANICRDYKGTGDIENETYLVSFRYGLQRLAYGFALGENVNFISDGISFEAPEGMEIFPCGNFDGSSDQLQFSRFYAFVESLHQLLEQRNGEKRLSEWTDYMKEYLLSAFIYLNEKEEDIESILSEADIEDSDEENNSRFFENAIDDFLSASATPNAEELISFEVFRLLFTGYISNRITERGSYRGGITFANFQSMQGLDYKFIAILGMNYDVLPRNKQLPYFHLENKNKIGSFNIKEIDKYTFLQTLLAADNYLYLSYIGRSPKDNSKRPASVLIDQVLDSFERKTEEPKPESCFWIQHPLHSFSSRYNQEQYPMLKWHKIKKPSEISLSSLDKKEDKPEISNISLDQLIAFVKNPFKHYLNKAFGIYLTEEDNSLNENELLDDPDNLIKYYIKNELIERSEEKPLVVITRKFKHKAFVPLSNIGTSINKTIDSEISQMRTDFNNLKESYEAVSVTETLFFEKISLSAKITAYNNNQLLLCTSKDSSAPKYIIEAWIRHLFAAAAGKNMSTYLLKLQNNNILFKAESPEKLEAISILSSLVDLYLEGCNKLFAYDPGVEVTKNYKNFISSDFLDKYPSLAVRLELFDELKMIADTELFSELLLKKIAQVQNLIPHTT